MPLRDRALTGAVAVLFFLLYLLGPTVFGARIESENDGLRVEQYGRRLIPYSEIRRCIGFFLFPWQVVIITTKEKFPLNVLISGDTLSGRRRSLTQAGTLAAAVKSRIEK